MEPLIEHLIQAQLTLQLGNSLLPKGAVSGVISSCCDCCVMKQFWSLETNGKALHIQTKHKQTRKTSEIISSCHHKLLSDSQAYSVLALKHHGWGMHGNLNWQKNIPILGAETMFLTFNQCGMLGRVCRRHVADMSPRHNFVAEFASTSNIADIWVEVSRRLLPICVHIGYWAHT